MRGQNKLIDFFLRSLSKVDLLLITYLIFLLFLSNIKSIYNSIPSIFSVFINFDYLRNIDSAFGFVVGAILLISVPPMYLLGLRALLSNDDINTLEILSPMYHLILIVLYFILLDALGTIKSAVTAYFITILVVEIIRSVLSKVPFTKS